ncbi:MAG: hypothetical protein HC894_03160 [Microcoleus sp. SM1_3_4]|nr:hypothetical protein [Microcoleus sp. SM1_3_4]
MTLYNIGQNPSFISIQEVITMPRNEPPRNNKLDAWYPDKNSEASKLEKGVGFDFIRRIFGVFQPSKTSVETVFDKLATIWPTKIAPVLIEQFGRGTTLYAILYSGEYSDEIILEIWDPKHIESKPSQCFYSSRGTIRISLKLGLKLK